MPQINLLPWREEKRKFELTLFIVSSVLTSIVAAGAVGVLYLYLSSVNENQLKINDYLAAQIKIFDTNIASIAKLQGEKTQLINRAKVVEDLQLGRSSVIKLIDNICKIIPSGLSLDEISKKDNTVTLMGKGLSYTMISDFMTQLKLIKWLTNPKLSNTQMNGQNNKDNNASQEKVTFTLQFTQLSDEVK